MLRVRGVAGAVLLLLACVNNARGACTAEQITSLAAKNPSGLDFFGNDIFPTAQALDAQACADKCLSMPDCYAIVIKTQNKGCWLKNCTYMADIRTLPNTELSIDLVSCKDTFSADASCPALAPPGSPEAPLATPPSPDSPPAADDVLTSDRAVGTIGEDNSTATTTVALGNGTYVTVISEIGPGGFTTGIKDTYYSDANGTKVESIAPLPEVSKKGGDVIVTVDDGNGGDKTITVDSDNQSYVADYTVVNTATGATAVLTPPPASPPPPPVSSDTPAEESGSSGGGDDDKLRGGILGGVFGLLLLCCLCLCCFFLMRRRKNNANKEVTGITTTGTATTVGGKAPVVAGARDVKMAGTTAASSVGHIAVDATGATKSAVTGGVSKTTAAVGAVGAGVVGTAGVLGAAAASGTRSATADPDIVAAAGAGSTGVLIEQLDRIHKHGIVLLNKYKLLGPSQRRVGGHGVVQFASDATNPDKQYAMKFFLDKQAFDVEESLYKATPKQEFLAPVEDVFSNANKELTYLGMGGPLPPMVVRERGEALDEWSKRCNPDYRMSLGVIKQLIKIVYDMHQSSLVHRDLKPTNTIWLPSKAAWTIVDFGSAAAMGKRVPFRCTPAYAAPEIVTAGMNHYTQVVAEAPGDVWALGVMAYEQFTGTRVLRGVDRDQLFRTMRGEVPLPWEMVNTPDYDSNMRKLGSMKALVLRMLHRDAERRITMPDVYRDAQKLV